MKTLLATCLENGLHVHFYQPSEGKESTEVVPALPDHPGVNAMVEQWIATRSVAFIGTFESRYSGAIRGQRILLGLEWETSNECFCFEEHKGKDELTRQPDGSCRVKAVHFPTQRGDVWPLYPTSP
eukprot:GHVN01089842.1.p1 GENE.GHVN01089842.1~~GHVN01089842.1.p1  ORF type:complete len:126 (+),score=16.33 GHVN01089842.1:303-680(+)